VIERPAVSLNAYIVALVALGLSACTNQQVEQSLTNPGLNRDVCIVTNMAATTLLEREIDQLKNGFMARADLTEEASARVEADLARMREAINTLLQQRADMLRNDDWNDTEQAASDMAMMNALASKADDRIGAAEAEGTSGMALAKEAMDCAQGRAT